jgi:predicted ester cyclase
MSAKDNNTAVVRRYFEEFHSQRRHDIIDQIIDPPLVEPTREATTALLTAFPDYRIAITAQVAEGDLVATVWSARGTHGGEWASPAGSIAPSGRSVAWTGTTTLRIYDGRITEVVGSNWDHLGILQQLGVVSSPAPRSGA